MKTTQFVSIVFSIITLNVLTGCASDRSALKEQKLHHELRMRAIDNAAAEAARAKEKGVTIVTPSVAVPAPGATNTPPTAEVTVVLPDYTTRTTVVLHDGTVRRSYNGFYYYQVRGSNFFRRGPQIVVQGGRRGGFSNQPPPKQFPSPQR